MTDKQSPQVDRCVSPPPFIKKVNKDKPIIAEWEEPIFSDNSNQPIRIKQSHKMTDYFDTGTTVVVYKAIDKSGNSASCSIDITVKGKSHDCYAVWLRIIHLLVSLDLHMNVRIECIGPLGDCPHGDCLHRLRLLQSTRARALARL